MKIILMCVLSICLLSGCYKTKNESLVDNPFQLTKEEQRIYTDFQKDLNERHLINLELISVAKIYVQSELDENYDVTYALYTDRKDYIQWSKEEDAKINKSNRATKKQLLEIFTNIDKGEFIQTGDYRGYIEYESSKDPESKNGFQMVKDEDGIWNVGFMPIQ